MKEIFNFTPFPILETENLVLRKLDPIDVSDIFAMRNDPRMHLYTDSKPDESTDETLSYIDKMNQGVDMNKWIIWAMEDKQSKKVIGSISIWNLNVERNSGELGYGIIPEFQGRGLMKEALFSVSDYAFQVMNLDILEAYTEQNNIASIKLLERCTFIETGRVDEKGYFSDRMYRMIVFRMVNQK